MSTAAEILVIILSVVLFIFLALSIVVVVLLIKITRQVKSTVESANRTVHTVEHITSDVGKLTSPYLIVRAIKRYIRTVIHKRKEK